jgi:hypothetical protein
MNRKADGSLPSMKAAMKACKGRAAADKECRKTSRYGKYRNPEKFCNDNGFFRPVVHPSLKAELEAKVGKKPYDAYLVNLKNYRRKMILFFIQL